jgi:hypothetical protein
MTDRDMVPGQMRFVLRPIVPLAAVPALPWPGTALPEALRRF